MFHVIITSLIAFEIIACWPLSGKWRVMLCVKNESWFRKGKEIKLAADWQLQGRKKKTFFVNWRGKHESNTMGFWPHKICMCLNGVFLTNGWFWHHFDNMDNNGNKCLVSGYSIPGTMQSAFHDLFHLLILTALFADEKIDVQKDSVQCLHLFSWKNGRAKIWTQARQTPGPEPCSTNRIVCKLDWHLHQDLLLPSPTSISLL